MTVDRGREKCSRLLHLLFEISGRSTYAAHLDILTDLSTSYARVGIINLDI